MEELLQALILTFADPQNLLILFGACALSFLMGVLPGLSATEAMLILLPLTFGMDLNQSMIMMASAYAAADVGASLTSIVFGIPGSSTNLTTLLDGHALHRKGRTIFAVSAAATSSAVAGILSLLFVVILLPLMEPLSLLFGPAEWFGFVMLGLVVLAFSGEAPPLRGLLSGALGLLAGTIGLGVVTGTPRYTFGLPDLWGGVPIIAAFIGIYALAEALWMASGREASVAVDLTSSESLRVRTKGQVKEGMVATFRCKGTLFFGTVIGWVIGIIPGVGATLANIVGYFTIRDTSSDRANFGKGEVKGVIAAETSNNATIGGALIPTLAIGIPGSIGTAILLGVFMINGVQPGTNVFTENLTVTWVILLSVGASTILASGVVLAGAWRIVRLTKKVPTTHIAPVIVFISFISVLLARGNPIDLVFAAVLAALGYLMKIYRFSRISFVIALMLGPVVESSFFQALSIGRGSYDIFFQSAVSWIIWIAIAGCLLFQVLLRRSRTLET